MKDLVDGLNIRYNTALESVSDRDFYMGLYHYFDFIQKTPQLKDIFDSSEREYQTKFHDEIWKEKRKYSEEELDVRSSQVSKLERFNLYSVGCTIFVRIYSPIDDYKNTPELDPDQDPVALILTRGVDYVVALGKWSKDIIRVYNKWFDGKRNYYETEFRRFHIMLLDELAKPKVEIKIKPEIKFNKENSILSIGDKEVNLKLKNDKPNSHYVLEYIFENEEGLKVQSFYTDIIKSKFLNEKLEWRSIYRACEDINTKVSKQAGMSNFLVIKSGKSGYTQVNSDYL